MNFPQDSNLLYRSILAATICSSVAFGLTDSSAQTLEKDQSVGLTIIVDTSWLDPFATGQNARPAIRAASTSRFPFPNPSLLSGGRIVSVNSKTAGGYWTANVEFDAGTTDPRPSANRLLWTFDIQQADGISAGSIYAEVTEPEYLGVFPQPGVGVWLVGGTGAYFGAQGSIAMAPLFPNDCAVSDSCLAPSQKLAFQASLVALTIPRVAGNAMGPAVIHASDGAQISQARPAAPGEVLTLFATDLIPAVVAGGVSDWPVEPTLLKNVPLEISINGVSAEVLYVGAYPRAWNAYQVNFRVPAAIQSGSATLEIADGFIAGPSVVVPIR